MSALKATHTFKIHYHIRWSSSALLDWQAFDSLKEAEAVARYLIRADETYSIEAVSGDCKRCLQADSLGRNAAYNNARKARIA